MDHELITGERLAGPISKVVGLCQTLLRRRLEHFFPEAILEPAGDRSVIALLGPPSGVYYRLADDPDSFGVEIEWFGTRYLFLPGSPAPFLPSDLHGSPVVIIAICYAGRLEDGERVLAPLRRFGEPLIDLIRATPYTSHQGMFDASVPHGLHYYWKSDYLGPLDDATIDTLIGHAWQAPSPMSYTIMFHLGGAIRRIDGSATAFEDRNAEHALNINAVWSDSKTTDIHLAWARTFWEAVHPLSTGVYVNFLGAEGQERVQAAYGPNKYHRLMALKRKYDPTNLFRLNQNIPPVPERP